MGSVVTFVWDAATVQNSTVLTLSTDVGSVDLLGEVAGIASYEALAAGAKRLELFGMTVSVAGLDDLISMKRAAGRVKDQLHLVELEHLRKLVQDHQDAE